MYSSIRCTSIPRVAVCALFNDALFPWLLNANAEW
jgi:hypothetical protein